MAWSWSHTEEAYQAAKLNLRLLDAEELRTIYAEWIAWTGHGPNTSELDLEIYNTAFNESAAMNPAQLINEIWPRMETNATCDNGGFHAWACPFGCHTVSFTEPKDLKEPEHESREKFDSDDDTIFRDYLNETSEPVKIYGQTFDQGTALMELDYTAFCTMRNDMQEYSDVYTCPDCKEEYSDEDEAKYCCQDRPTCPDCQSEYDIWEEAADCCRGEA